MPDLVTVSALIDRIYGAAETGSDWSGCLDDICRVLDGTGANLLHHDPSARTGAVLVAARTDPAALKAYQEYFHRVDPWAASLLPGAMVVGRVVQGQSVLSHEEMRDTEYYADLGQRFGLTRALFGFTGRYSDGSSSVISINRSDPQPDFDEEAVGFLSVLMPHLGRALQTQARWAAAQQNQGATLDALEAMPCGVLLVDAEARICHANARGAALLAAADGIATDDGRLRGNTVEATKRLRDTCAAVAATRAAVLRHPGEAFTLPRSGSGSLQILIAPVQHRGVCMVPHRSVTAIVYVSDPDADMQADHGVLAALLGLTPTEARVAALVGRGQGPQDVATQMGYTLETARWYVKQILAKTGCRSRTELAIRIARSLPMTLSR